MSTHSLHTSSVREECTGAVDSAEALSKALCQRHCVGHCVSHCHTPLPVVRCGEHAEAASEVFIEVVLVGEVRAWDRRRALICHARPHVRGQVRTGACQGAAALSCRPLLAYLAISTQSRRNPRIAQGREWAEIGRRIARWRWRLSSSACLPATQCDTARWHAQHDVQHACAVAQAHSATQWCH